MHEYTVDINLVVRCENEDHAAGIAFGAAQHLEETFNDDGSILQASLYDDGVTLNGDGNYEVAVILRVLAESDDEAHGIAEGAADHLLETFNEDESILSAAVPDGAVHENAAQEAP